MFSLRESAAGQFIYRCNDCGWESATMTKQQAINYTREHQCAIKPKVLIVAEPVNPAAKEHSDMRLHSSVGTRAKHT